MEFLSTTSLANELDISSSELFAKLKSMGWIDRSNEKWVLTSLGKQKVGLMRTNSKFGEYIVWPEGISLGNESSKSSTRLLNSTALGKHFGVSAQRINLLLNELGWIEKTIAGWDLTKLGASLKGRVFEYDNCGTSVSWPESIINNHDFIQMFEEGELKGPLGEQNKNLEISIETEDFRKKYPAEYRTKDGHYVRSKAEMAIDDSLYLWGIPHAYEKKLPNTEEEVYSDFHIPSGNNRPKAVYIEYWGMEKDDKYNNRKKKKIEIYNELGLHLIQLNDSDIKNIEDTLQRHLLKYGIKVS